MKNKKKADQAPYTLIAHRGYSGKYPENTLLAYQAAYAFGARWMECDIQLTKDKVPVLQHDESLLRMTGEKLDVRKISNKKFKQFSNHYPEKFGNEFLGNAATPLKKLTKWMRSDREINMFIEVKQHSIDTFGVETCLRQIFERVLDVKEQCIIISFNDTLVEQARELFEFQVGWVIPEWSDAVKSRAEQLQPEFLFTNKDLLPDDPSMWWRDQWQWAIYNVDKVEELPQWLDKGLTMVETNEIGELLHLRT